MKRTIPRSALIVGCVAALAALAAGSAQAAVLSYTATPTAVTADSATVNGSVVPGGIPVAWQFSYGPVAQPFAQTYSDGGIILAGSPPSVPVLAQLTNLTPATAYSFQLVTTSGTPGSTTSPLANSYGGVLTFTTKGAGAASLTKTKLKVRGGRAQLGVKCASTITCHGTIAITTRHRGKAVACGRAPFTVNPGAKKTFWTGKLSGECRALLTAASPKAINAHLEALFSTYQKTISQPVTLTLVP
jgi:hypothetical protein